MAEGTDNAVLKILISMGLDPKGADEAVAQINRVRQASESAAGAGDSAVPDAWKSWDRYKHVLSETGEEALGTHEKIHVLHLGLSEMGAKIPELGGLLRLLFNPMTAGFALGVAGLEAYFHWQEKIEERHHDMIMSLQKINDEMREMIGSGPTIQQNWIANLEIAAKMRAEVQGLAYDLKVFENSSKVADIFTEDALQRRIDLRKDESAILESQIGMLEAIGKITGPQGEDAKRRAKEQADIDAAKDEVTKAKAAVSQAQADRDEYAKRAGAHSAEDVAAQQGVVQGVTEKIRRATDAVENEAKYKREQEQIIDEQKNREKKHPLQWNDAEDAIAEVRRNIRDITDRAQKGSLSLPGLEQQLANEQAKLKAMQDVQDKLDDMDQNIRVLGQKATDAQAALPTKIATVIQQAATEAVTARAQQGENFVEQFNRGVEAIAGIKALVQDNQETVAQIAARGQAAQSRLSAGVGTSQDQHDFAVYQQLQQFQAQYSALRDLLTAVGDNADSVTALLNKQIGSLRTTQDIHLSTKAWLDNMQNQLNNLAAQFRAGGRPVTP